MAQGTGGRPPVPALTPSGWPSLFAALEGEPADEVDVQLGAVAGHLAYCETHDLDPAVFFRLHWRTFETLASSADATRSDDLTRRIAEAAALDLIEHQDPLDP